MLGVIRMEPSQHLPDMHLVAHVLGEIRPSTYHVHEHLGVGVEVLHDVRADAPEGTSQTLKEGRGYSAGYLEKCEDAIRLSSAQRGGARPSLGVSWLFSGCPDTIDVHADASTIPADAPSVKDGGPWTLETCRAFARRADGLLSRVLQPGSYSVALHLDEKAVHVQAESVALCIDGRVGFNSIRETMARMAPDFEPLNAAARESQREAEAVRAAKDERLLAAGKKPKKRRKWRDRGAAALYLNSAAQMRLVHDVYADAFAEFGIVRGKGGARQHHEKVDRAKAMDAKLRAVRSEEERARVEAERTRAEAERARVETEQRRAESEALTSRRDAIKAAVDDLSKDVVALDTEAERARERHDRDALAAEEARKKRAHEEAVGWGLLRSAGRKALRKIEQRTAERDAAIRERDAVIVERDEAQSLAHRWKEHAAKLEMKLSAMTLRYEELKARVERFKRSAFVAGVRSAARPVRAVLARLGVTAEASPRVRSLLEALDSGSETALGAVEKESRGPVRAVDGPSTDRRH